jgi:hypothetical protein
LAILLLLFSCSKEKNTTSRYCENEIQLFSVADTIPVLQLNYHHPESQILDSIEQALKQDLCFNKVDFGLSLDDGNVISVYVLKEYPTNVIVCYISHPKARILLNKYGDLMLNNNIVLIDSVPYFLREAFINNTYDLEETFIKWTEETPRDSIEKTFKNIIAGYLLLYDSMALETFNKKTCSLTPEELNQLKKDFPFIVKLDIGRLVRLLPVIKEIDE